ncbi:glycosyltransferase family 2 protein [Vibrio fluvialis]|nr:glycosyltransferase family 2 protein [Vibrio fluvialis]
MIYIAVVSHGHSDLIRKINCLPALANRTDIEVWLVDNLGESDLRLWCSQENINYLQRDTPCGFGANNNYAFDRIRLKSSKGDYFLVLNPDVDIELKNLDSLLNICKTQNIEIASINLELPDGTPDSNIRRYPRVLDWFLSFVFKLNKSIETKEEILDIKEIDWAAGSFLLFTCSSFQKIKGFDESYFMYCEDIDICHRARSKYGIVTHYIPQISARHYAQHSNKKFLSKHFFWHLTSIARYLIKRNTRFSK